MLLIFRPIFNDTFLWNVFFLNLVMGILLFQISCYPYSAVLNCLIVMRRGKRYLHSLFLRKNANVCILLDFSYNCLTFKHPSVIEFHWN